MFLNSSELGMGGLTFLACAFNDIIVFKWQICIILGDVIAVLSCMFKSWRIKIIIKMATNYKNILVVIGLVSIVPLIIFVFKFWKFEISSNPSDRSNFAVYLSGTIGTLVTLASFIILTKISIDIHKLSSDEHENSLIRERKREAYDNLSMYIPLINRIPLSLLKSSKSINTEFIKDKIRKGEEDYILELLENINTEISSYLDYHLFLFNFKLRYSHLFSFDFKDSNIERVIETSNKYKSSLEAIHENMLNFQKMDPESLKNNMLDHVNEMVVFLNLLRGDLNNK